MLRAVIKYTLVAIGLAAFAAYLWFGRTLRMKGAESEVCTAVEVFVLDSNEIGFVDSRSVNTLIQTLSAPIGKKLSMLDIHGIESALENTGIILHSEVSVDGGGHLVARVTQRDPILRMETRSGGFYVDENCFIFPLSPHFSSYVPIVSGEVPLRLPEGFTGILSDKKESKWVKDMLNISVYIQTHPVWNAQIQQIEVEADGDLIMYLRASDFPVIFGGAEGYLEKFDKLHSFYAGIVPKYGMARYDAVNLKYRNQIVCNVKQEKK